MAPTPALSFGPVADAYHRGRPGYPRAAASWLTGSEPCRVLELGAGTGKLTAELVSLGHQVLATDPLEPMLRHLLSSLSGVRAAVSTAEGIPLRPRSVDVVVCAQSFHWFDLDRALPEIARVLRPGGRLALAWNLRDQRIPWVRRLGDLIGTPEQETDPTNALIGSQLFGFVESATFRFWQPSDRARIRDLVRSRSNIAQMQEPEREQVLAKVDTLYDDYGRGPDGMLLPYLTRCFAATVRAPALHEDASVEKRSRVGRLADPPTEDDGGALLIDFP